MDLAHAFTQLFRRTFLVLTLTAVVTTTIGIGIWRGIAELEDTISPRHRLATELHLHINGVIAATQRLALVDTPSERTAVVASLDQEWNRVRDTAVLLHAVDRSVDDADLQHPLDGCLSSLKDAVERTAGAASAAALAGTAMIPAAARSADHTNGLVKALAETRQGIQAKLRIEREQFQRFNVVAVKLGTISATLERMRPLILADPAKATPLIEAIEAIASDSTVSNSGRLRETMTAMRKGLMAPGSDGKAALAEQCSSLASEVDGWVAALQRDAEEHGKTLEHLILTAARLNALAVRATTCDSASRQLTTLAFTMQLAASPAAIDRERTQAELLLSETNACLTTVEDGLNAIGQQIRPQDKDSVSAAVGAIRSDLEPMRRLVLDEFGVAGRQRVLLQERTSTREARDKALEGLLRYATVNQERVDSTTMLNKRALSRIATATALAPVAVVGLAALGIVLTWAFVHRSRRELSRQQAIKDVQDQRLHALVATMRSEATTLGTAATHLTEVSQRLDRSARETATAVMASHGDLERIDLGMSSVVTAAEELTSTINEITRSAHEAAAVALEGVNEATSANEHMRRLQEQTHGIEHISDLINSIAQRTNLLALNAQIEAAHAGKAGTGFAVVAMEVKNLAQATMEQVEAVSAQIAAIQASLAEASMAMERTHERAQRIRNLQDGVAAAVEEQSATVGEIARQMNDARSATTTITGSIDAIGSKAHQTTEDARLTLRSAEGITEHARTMADMATSP